MSPSGPQPSPTTLCAALLVVLWGAGCVSSQVPKDALALSPESLATRQLQSRRFSTRDERALLIAAAGLLQDTGFAIDESETGLGVIVGSKDREATDTGQVVAALLLAGLAGTEAVWDEKQKIRASLVTRASDLAPDEIILRVTFQRIVWNNQGTISRLETVDDEEIYQEFFEKLSKAVFLEANQI